MLIYLPIIKIKNKYEDVKKHQLFTFSHHQASAFEVL